MHWEHIFHIAVPSLCPRLEVETSKDPGWKGEADFASTIQFRGTVCALEGLTAKPHQLHSTGWHLTSL